MILKTGLVAITVTVLGTLTTPASANDALRQTCVNKQERAQQLFNVAKANIKAKSKKDCGDLCALMINYRRAIAGVRDAASCFNAANPEHAQKLNLKADKIEAEVEGEFFKIRRLCGCKVERY